MNAVLPAGIESYLRETGFSSTEMLVLRKLLEEESLTVRELASKTGKSTGVLDQAMKKLLSKRIAVKGTINGQPRYSIQSLDTIVRWVKEDMQVRKQMLERRHQNFESFISSLKLDRARPDIEHFSGSDGVQQAYLRLLEAGEELLTITPIVTSIEEDPLRHFKVDFFRKRQVRKIFQRVLAPDTPLARRFQTRDPFEYRKTLLIPEQDLPVTFEKIICGSIVACFNHDNQTACFLKYPDLAKAERLNFEALWNRTLNPQNPAPASPNPSPVLVPLKTRLLSSFREFILSPRSIATLVLFALVAATLTFGLYKSNRELNLQRMRDKVTAIAATAALQFDAEEVNTIKTPSDIHKPEYANIVAKLNLVRRSNTQIQYAYIFRKTSDPMLLNFVADADSLIPSEKKDLNRDGFIDEKDSLLTPGDPYGALESPGLLEGFQRPTSDLGQDQWGSFISGYAPIKDKQGRPVALLGFDIFATELDKISAESFSPLLVFAALFLCFLIGRFFAMNRSLLQECLYLLRKNIRHFFAITAFVCIIAAVIGFAFLRYERALMIRETGKRLVAIAVTAVNEFDMKDIENLRKAEDMRTPAYQRVYSILNNIGNENPEVSYAYVMRKNSASSLFEFVADADSNYDLPAYSKFSIFDETALGEFDENVWPGVAYDASLNPVYINSTIRPSYSEIFDQWGTAITGCAPMQKQSDVIIILCLDIKSPTRK